MDVPHHSRTDAPSNDLASRVVASAGAIDRAGVWWVLRALLCVVAGAYLVIDVIPFLFYDGPSEHLAHHLGVFELAYAVTLVTVAIRPARARSLVPFTLVLAVGMAFVAVVDLATGHAGAVTELSHLLEIAGLVLVWLLATRRGRSPIRPRPALRAVPDERPPPD